MTNFGTFGTIRHRKMTGFGKKTIKRHINTSRAFHGALNHVSMTIHFNFLTL